jgi:UDP-glucose 4-epimerase
MSRKILVTGVSSFTGSHIARALVENGDEVWACLSRDRKSYAQDPLVESRLVFSKVSHFVENAAFGSDVFLKHLDAQGADLFINHGADIKNYRKADFDFQKSFASATHRMREVVALLKAKACRRVLHSGSMFEPGEGYSQAPGAPASESPAVSIYGVSKNLVWETLKFFCEEAQLPLSKIVIPNPIGIGENPDRLAPFMAKEWKAGRETTLTTPKLVRDNLPAEWLARIYVDETYSKEDLSVRRPRGFVISNKEFIEKLATAYRKISNSAAFKIEEKPTREPLIRKNTEPVPELSDDAEITRFWKSWAEFLFNTF